MVSNVMLIVMTNLNFWFKLSNFTGRDILSVEIFVEFYRQVSWVEVIIWWSMSLFEA